MCTPRPAITLFIFLFLFETRVPGQDFVRVKDGMLYDKGVRFSFIGANAYFLQQLAAQGDTGHIEDVFNAAKSIGLSCIRTWGFFDSSDSTHPSVIQLSPQRYNERALRALDYVLYKADLFGIKLLIPLVNNWEDFGGMNQYVRWYAELNPKIAKPGSVPNSSEMPSQEKNLVGGVFGRFYYISVAGGYVHDDFYRVEEIKSWYKAYLAMITSRVNTYNGRLFKDDQTILAWELANEPRSSDKSGELVHSWVSEMASHLKLVDPNHLVATGEEGFDISENDFHERDYNNQSWMFDGTTGISFLKNTIDPNIDIAGIHLYSDPWNIDVNNGSRWIGEHAAVSKRLGKPLIVGEFGVRANQSLVYEAWLNTLVNSSASGGLVWQLVYEGWTDTDGYSIRCESDALVCNVLRTSALLMRQRDLGELQRPPNFSLHQNFPNPFNGVTVIRYDLSSDARVQLDIFTELGQKFMTLFDGWKPAGHYVELFGERGLSSGVYFYRISVSPTATRGLASGGQTGSFLETKKMLLIR